MCADAEMSPLANRVAACLQVRDFTFSPDDGRIDSIKFDRFGLPAVSDTLVSVCGLPVWEVLRVELTRLLIRSSPQISKETDGLLDRATRALFDMQVLPSTLRTLSGISGDCKCCSMPRHLVDAGTGWRRHPRLGFGYG